MEHFRLHVPSTTMPLNDVIPTEQLSPIPSPATKVSAATAKKQHQYNDNQYQFHGRAPLTVRGCHAPHACSGDRVLRTCRSHSLSLNVRQRRCRLFVPDRTMYARVRTFLEEHSEPSNVGAHEPFSIAATPDSAAVYPTVFRSCHFRDGDGHEFCND